MPKATSRTAAAGNAAAGTDAAAGTAAGTAAAAAQLLPASWPTVTTKRRRRLASYAADSSPSPYPPAIHAEFEALLQCARRLARHCDPPPTVAVADLGTACEDIHAQLLVVRQRSVRKQAAVVARTTRETTKQAALGARFSVVKLTSDSTGDRGRVWRLHRSRLDAEAREAMAVCDALEALVTATVKATAGSKAVDDGHATTGSSVLHLRRRTITKKRNRRTFYVCSGALATADGTCQAIHCGHSGAQRAQPTHVRRDVEHHIAHVHRVARATDGYEGSGLVANETEEEAGGEDGWGTR